MSLKSEGCKKVAPKNAGVEVKKGKPQPKAIAIVFPKSEKPKKK